MSLVVLSGKQNDVAFDPDTDSDEDGKIGMQEAILSLRYVVESNKCNNHGIYNETESTCTCDGGYTGETCATYSQQCGDTQAIAIVGDLQHNGQMVFTSITNLFGSTGPDLIYRSDLSTASENTRYDLSQAEGQGTVAQEGFNVPLIERAEGMPFNKAFVVGSEGGLEEQPKFGSMRVVSPQGSTPATYEHVMYWWPKEHQDNAQLELDGDCVWQIKTIWHFFTQSKADDLFRVHNCFGAWYKTGLYFKGSVLVGNLFSNYSWYPGLGEDDYTDGKSSHVKADKFISQTFIKHSALDDSSGSVDMYLRNVTKGNVGHSQKSDSRTTVALPRDNHLGPDQFTFPGYARGFNTLLDAHVYFSDIYITHGVGAAARIELVNNSDYEKANKVSPFTIESWSPNAITVKSKMGIFSTQMNDDDELYFAIHNENNELVAMIQYCSTLAE